MSTAYLLSSLFTLPPVFCPLRIKMEAPKTADFAKFLNAVGCNTKTLVVTAEADQNVVKSGRNIPGCEVTFANLLNVYDIVNANKLVVDKAALAKIEEVFA